MRITEIANYLKAELINLPSSEEADVILQGIQPIPDAKTGYLTFLTSAEYEKYVETTGASAIIVKAKREDTQIPQIIHENPYYAMAKASQLFDKTELEQSGVSERAEVHASAIIGKDVIVFPFAYVSAGVVVGDRSVLYPGVYLGTNSKVGSDTVIHPNVTLGERCELGSRVVVHAGSSIGPDGFGFAVGNGEIAKISQVGNVVVADDVEIGGCCTLDRATMGSTTIGKGTKLDSHVHVGHNVTIGENSMLCGVSKIAGSATIGDWCVLGGDSSVSNNCVLSNGVRIGAKAGVTKNLTEAGDYMGFPAVPAGQWRRQIASVRRYGKLEKRVAELEKLLNK